MKARPTDPDMKPVSKMTGIRPDYTPPAWRKAFFGDTMIGEAWCYWNKDMDAWMPVEVARGTYAFRSSKNKSVSLIPAHGMGAQDLLLLVVPQS